MSAVSDFIGGGSAFTNPIAPALSAATSQIDAYIGGGFDALVAGNPLWSNPSDVVSAKDALQSLQTTLSSFGVHTDRLSGVSGGEPSMATIVNVINVTKTSCGDIGNAFGSLTKGVAMIGNVVSFLQDLASFIAGGPAALLSTALDFVTNISTQITNDVQAFVDAQAAALLEVFSNSLVNLFDDPCFGDILNSVATPALSGLLGEANNALRNVVNDQLEDVSQQVTGAISRVI